MTTPKGLSVILPAYNEEENIASVLEESIAVLERLSVPPLAEAGRWEIVVVNDGSRDRTAEEAARVAAQYPENVRVMSHDANRGYGAALRTGFEASQHDLVFYTDADGQFSLGDLRYFLPHIDDHDMLVGFRVYRFDPLFRLVMSWGYNRLVRILFRVRVRDIDCSFKLMRREVLESIGLETDDFFIDTELVARARRWNFRIMEKGVKHYPRRAGESSLRPSHIPRTLRTVFRMWWRIHFGHWSPKAHTAAASNRAGPSSGE